MQLSFRFPLGKAPTTAGPTGSEALGSDLTWGCPRGGEGGRLVNLREVGLSFHQKISGSQNGGVFFPEPYFLAILWLGFSLASFFPYISRTHVRIPPF